MNIKNKLKAILVVISIYLTYTYGIHLLLKFAFKPLIYHTPFNTNVFMQLDFGRYLYRIASFLWATCLFFTALLFVDKNKFKDSVLMPGNKSKRSFLIGCIFGATLLLATVIITILSGSATLQLNDNWATQIIPTILLYVTAMLMTAYSEELIFRGMMLNRLLTIFNPHIAITGIALAFALIHLQYSLIYAVGGFFAGLLLGYGFIVFRNLYFCIGWHFGWNLLESLIYSPRIFQVHIYNKLLAGQRNISPDQEGLVTVIVMIFGFLMFMLCTHAWELKKTVV